MSAALLQALDGRERHYRRLLARGDCKQRLGPELKACLAELAWVREQVAAHCTAEPAPKIEQLSLV